MSSAQSPNDSIDEVLRTVVQAIEGFSEFTMDKIRKDYAEDALILWCNFPFCTFSGVTDEAELVEEFCSVRVFTPADAVKAAMINRVLRINGRNFLSAEVDDVWPEVTEATIELIKSRLAHVYGDLEAEMRRREKLLREHNVKIEIAVHEEERSCGSRID
jgi:hypothetical protein